MGNTVALGLQGPPAAPPRVIAVAFSLDVLLPRAVRGSPYAVTFTQDGSVLHAHQDPATMRFGAAHPGTSRS